MHNVIVQVETAAAVEAVEEILDVDGVDAIFVGPSDLAASYGAIGQQADSRVRSAVRRCIEAAGARGKPCGVNAFDLGLAREYREMGVEFLLIGADITLLARGSEQLASALDHEEDCGS
jgi:4-hydroxy-2-oxoheptanedioate aldolase